MAWLRCENLITKTSSNYVLRKALVTIGRAKGNDVVLDDPMIAKTHASLVRSGSQYTLSVTERGAELYLNGKPVRTAVLNEGDEAQLGAFKLVFAAGQPTEEDLAPPSAKSLDLDVLERLVALSGEIMRDTNPTRLFTTVLRGLVELTRAEKGFIIVLKDGDRHLAASHNVEETRLDMHAVSDSIVDQVIQTLEAIIVSDAMHDARFGKAKSVVDLRLSSVMCAPLVFKGALLGVIYLGNDRVTDLFNRSDLALLRIYAAQAAVILDGALTLNQLKLDNRNLRDRLESGSQGAILGNCPEMKRVYKVLRRVAPTDLSVLVLGETGTGKEMVARELHNLSPRHSGPFIAINCGAIPENLLESELFGHRKGSFTGAITDKTGKIEAASGGTLFLDEIGEMPMNLQVKLLRVLQERVIERVGDLQPRKVDIRVVAATNKDLTELIQTGGFREDLLYRLNELTVDLPPLRDRGEDIALLAQYFLTKYRSQYDAKATGFSNTCLTAMRAAYWPGNVRELESRVKKALIMSDRSLLAPEDLSLGADVAREMQPLAEAEESFKIEYIRKALDANSWNKAATARVLGVDARTIFRYIEKFSDEA